MKICALTMAYRDYWALEQWYRHYRAMLGAEHLYVVAHGADPRLQEICPGASVITIPRGGLQGFDSWRAQMLNGFQRGLLAIYDWVIRTDADELVFADPGQWESLPAMLAQQQAPALFALGLDIYDFGAGPDLDSRRPALAQRRDAVFTGHYSKAWAFGAPLGLRRHGVEMRPRKLEKFPFVMPRGIYLAHLKHANLAAAEDMAPVRIEVASSKGLGNPGRAWLEADRESHAQCGKAAALPAAPWEDAEEEAWSALQDPVRDARISVLRARSLRFSRRTRLPEWFGRG